MGLLFGTKRALLGGRDLARIFKFNPLLTTFTPNMAKRTSPGPFETAPIAQGKWNRSGTPDNITMPRGNQVHSRWYENYDPHQGSVVLWITPEWDGNDGLIHNIIVPCTSVQYLTKHSSNVLRAYFGGGVLDVDVSAWTAGTTYAIVFRWDSKNTLDGTNFLSMSINNVHTFGRATYTADEVPAYHINIAASAAGTNSIDSIIEGLTIYRRPLFDGSYGVAANWDDSGPIDEIEEIYAAGAGQDPCLVTGSWDVVFCLPTNSTVEELVTGTGEAWSHPHSSGVLKHQWLEDGGYLGRPWAVLYDGFDTTIDCGSGATLDDMPDEANGFTVDIWARPDDWGESNTGHLVSKYVGDLSGGWMFGLDSANGLFAFVFCADTDALSYSGTDEFTPDGKWHKFTLFFHHTANGGDGKIYFAVDGKWISSYPSQVVGVGAYGSDAAVNLHIGNSSPAPSHTQEGCMGWIHLSNNDRHTHGTDFVPDRQPPATDGNSIEMWHLDEGTGVLINAEVTSPANDGTLANGTWEEQWDQETSPIVPYVIEFDGDASVINCGSAAIIDDLQDDAMTIEGWVNLADFVGSGGIIGKGEWATEGWVIWKSGGNINAVLDCVTSDPTGVSAVIPSLDKWLHFALTWDDAGDRKLRLFIDGILEDTSAVAGVGAIVSDAADNLYIGRLFGTESYMTGKVGWARISDNLRYSADFTPPSRLNPPGTDGNTIAQWNFRDGAGTTLLDETVNNIDGTIIPGDGGWNITPDMEIDSPGERIFNWGYVIGNDAVDEGIVQTLSGLVAGENYVVRAIAHVESASRGRPKIIIYDETNGAEITSLEGPSFYGVHDGLANAATLTDTTARFPQMLVDWTIYNITDGSLATITAISGDMQVITGALSGGTDDDWDIGDEYRIVPPGGPGEYDDYPWIETFTFELPTIARNGVGADCVSISVKLVNSGNEGVIKWHQIELLTNLIDNPSLETGAGNPWIPDGWANNLLDPGDTLQELVTVHSGNSGVEFAPGATATEQLFRNFAGTTGEFFTMGCWAHTNGDIQGDTTRLVKQTSVATAFDVDQSGAAVWEHLVGVGRTNFGSVTARLHGSTTQHFIDDAYSFKLDDVSLTVTPANLANSAESGGLRVDGRDTLTQPIPAGMLGATSGWVKFKWIPRHDAADAGDFGWGNPRMVVFWFDGTHYIQVLYSAAGSLRLLFNDGGGLHQANWNPATLNARTEYLLEIKYNSAQMEFIVDGVTQITIVAPPDFGAGIPTTVWWGSGELGIYQIDSVFSQP